jgi:hypothetical protein
VTCAGSIPKFVSSESEAGTGETKSARWKPFVAAGAIVFAMSPRGSNPAAALPAAGLGARVLRQVDRTLRLAAMLDRWDAEDLADEPDWDVSDLEPLSM